MKIAIIGAGIMGRLLAFEFVNAGNNVSIYELNDNSCSMAAAGMLAPVSELERSDTHIYHMGMAAIDKYWPAILAALIQPVYFKKSGTIVLSHPQEKADLTRFINIISAKLPEKKFRLNHDEFIQLEPELNKFTDTYYFPEEAHLDNQAVLAALKTWLLKANVKWHGNIYIEAVQDFRHDNDLVIDCRGMGAKSSFNNLQGIRGELLWLHAHDVHINRPIRFLHPRYSIYITPRPDAIYIVGASEIHAEDYSEISVRTTLELLTAAYYVHPGFAEAQVIKTVTQCRPTLPDHLPQIKFSDGFIAVNGLYRHGFLIAPTLAHEIANYVLGGKSSRKFPDLWSQYDD